MDWCVQKAAASLPNEIPYIFDSIRKWKWTKEWKSNVNLFIYFIYTDFWRQYMTTAVVAAAKSNNNHYRKKRFTFTKVLISNMWWYSNSFFFSLHLALLLWNIIIHISKFPFEFANFCVWKLKWISLKIYQMFSAWQQQCLIWQNECLLLLFILSSSHDKTAPRDNRIIF